MTEPEAKPAPAASSGSAPWLVFVVVWLCVLFFRDLFAPAKTGAVAPAGVPAAVPPSAVPPPTVPQSGRRSPGPGVEDEFDEFDEVDVAFGAAGTSAAVPPASPRGRPAVSVAPPSSPGEGPRVLVQFCTS